MHSYGRDFPHIGKVHVVLAAFAVGAYFLVVCGVRLAQGSFPGLAFLADVNVSPFVTLTIFGVLEFAFDRWAWRLLCGIPGVNVFDFSGKYSGKILASSKAEHPASITIKQTWSKNRSVLRLGQCTGEFLFRLRRPRPHTSRAGRADLQLLRAWRQSGEWRTVRPLRHRSSGAGGGGSPAAGRLLY